jgi:hypothetical protein
MPFPTGWPPVAPKSSVRSIRFFVSGTGTANFSDNAFLFIDDPGANLNTPLAVVPPGNAPPSPPLPIAPVDVSPPSGTGTAAVDANLSQPPALQAVPKATLYAGNIRVSNDEAPGGAALDLSFDGVIVQGRVLAGESITFRQRYECGISVKGVAAFRIHAW